MDAAVTFLLNNLKQLIRYQVDLISGAKDELDKLVFVLDIMKRKLEDTSNIENKNEVFKRWEEEIKEVIYEVEDVIDTYITDQKKKFFAKLWKPGGLAEKVKKLRENKVKPLFTNTIKEFDSFGNTAGDGSKAKLGKRTDKRNNKDPRQDNVVGFEDVTKTLISMLNEESATLDVVSVVGMPGLGKTTLAWKIFQSQEIKFEFPTLIWVNISQEFNKRDMLLTILKKFTQQEDASRSNTDENDLAKKVKDYLKRGKFLIFMDDIWTVEVWNEIKEVLPMENKMGKVLITSRNAAVAWYANRIRDPYQLRFLNVEESWKLLRLEIYGKVHVDKVLQRIGQNISTKCQGLPLSIIVIGGILVDKSSTPGGILVSKWREVCDSVDKYLAHGDKENQLDNIISLSYRELPYELRDCFLYLGMFPEEIPAWKLMQLWIAEGFIQPKPQMGLEKVAQDNLNNLINRNLVMVHKTKPDGEVKICRVHGTIRAFCKTQAASLFQEIVRNIGVFEPALENLVKYRHLCVHSYVHEFLKKKPKVPKARTFLCFSKAPIISGTEDIAIITNAFNLLRVFEANKIRFPKFPAKIAHLVHLRYLTLSGDDFEILPEAITKLWNLQTLIVDTSSRTLTVNANIWQMMQLRHFKTKASIILLGGRGTGGENFQTLGRLMPKSCTNEVLKKAKNLNTLGIRGDLKLLKAESLEEMEFVSKLKFVHDSYSSGTHGSPLCGVPNSNMLPLKLRILILSGTSLEWKHMSKLGRISTLEVLKLKDNAFTGDDWDASGVGFNRLEFLYIERTNLTYWTMSGDSFTRLRKLVLKNCEVLQGVPFELKSSLQMLSLERVTAFAVSSARKIEQAIKQEMEAEEEESVNKRVAFKLVIAPGDQVPKAYTQ